MLELVYLDKGKESVFALAGEETVIGRSPRADLAISDEGVSRFHAKIIRTAGTLSIQDLDSSNGTLVNDRPVVEAGLAPGDRITIGGVTIEIRESQTPSEAVELKDTGDLPEDTSAIVRAPEALERILRTDAGDKVKAADFARSHRLLRLVSQVAKVLVFENEIDGLLNRVMDLVFENFSADRGVLGLYEEDVLVPTVVRFRDSLKPSSAETIRIPTAITNKVRREKVSILTVDAQHDLRLSRSDSILAQRVRSAMCVPLWDKDKVIGIIYIDEPVHTGIFEPDDLDLLSALGNLAAVAIERARLAQRVQEEQATRARLERYHSPAVIETILKSRGSLDSLEMEERDVTVCFADVVGFTGMSEQVEPRDVGASINDVFTELTECVFFFEGTLDKYIGDCVMSVFGAPLAQPDHAVRAVRAALAMHQALEGFGGHGAFQKIQLRTGINSGKVVAGDIGSPKRRDYSVLGDTVNLASRLESQVAKPGWIVIGEATHAAVKDYFDCLDLGALRLRGKSSDVRAYRVMGEKQDRS